MERPGLVAAGHPETAAAAAATLRAGGNAFDAVVAAGFAAAVCEPCLTSLAGGGFVVARPARGDERCFDFFVAVPGLGAEPTPPGAPGPAGELDAVEVRFDHAVQVFHVGPASVATPGVLAGYLHVHDRLGRLPLRQVTAPAVALGRRGVEVDRFFAQLLGLLDPILGRTEAGRALFAPHGRPLRRGDRFVAPALADFIADVGAGAVTGFRAADLGGVVTDADLAAYAVVERAPLRTTYRDAIVVTNPPPSLGGSLVAHALARLAEGPPVGSDPASAVRLAEALVGLATARARLGAASTRGTTHVSVADGEGNVAAMTTSNGSCSGVFVGDTGVQLNNVMGEEDLHPAGFGALPPGARVGSMMAPTILEHRTVEAATWAAFGSGGSERIRSTLTQLVVHLVDGGLDWPAAVQAPRLHWDGRRLQAEPGLPAPTLAALRERWEVNEWPAPDLYFGGAHGVAAPGDAFGDPRRGGAALVVR